MGLQMESISPRRVAFELVAASFIVLFQELTLIRWLPAQVRVLAYFPNLDLDQCFSRSRSRLLARWAPLASVVVASQPDSVGWCGNRNERHSIHSQLSNRVPVALILQPVPGRACYPGR